MTGNHLPWLKRMATLTTTTIVATGVALPSNGRIAHPTSLSNIAQGAKQLPALAFYPDE
jgi:hypothetical protein